MNTLCVVSLCCTCNWNTLRCHDGACRFWKATLICICHEVDLSDLHWCYSSLCNARMPFVVFFNRGAEIVGIAPYFARLVLLEVLVELVVRRHQHLLRRLFFLVSGGILSRFASCSCTECRPWPDWQSRHRSRLAKHHAATPVLVKSRPQLHILRRGPCSFLCFQDSLHLQGVWFHATPLLESAL